MNRYSYNHDFVKEKYHTLNVGDRVKYNRHYLEALKNSLRFKMNIDYKENQQLKYEFMEAQSKRGTIDKIIESNLTITVMWDGEVLNRNIPIYSLELADE